MSEFEKVIGDIGKVLKERDNFAVVGHVKPDGDCLGSQTAMYQVLKNLGKKVRMFNQGPIIEHYKFIPEVDKMEFKWPFDEKPDVLIILDCGEPSRVTREFKVDTFCINIDHHLQNKNVGDLNYIDTSSSAVGEQLFYLFKDMGVTITQPIAESLYMSILADTGSFRFANTNARVFKVAAELTSLGANPAKVSTNFYENISAESLYITAGVLANLKIECGGKFVWGEIKMDVYNKFGGEDNEPEGLVSVLRGVRGALVSALIHEIPQGGLRVGLRSKDGFDVATIARKFGGGGHFNASGCYIEGNYDELREKILDEIRKEFATNKY